MTKEEALRELEKAGYEIIDLRIREPIQWPNPQIIPVSVPEGFDQVEYLIAFGDGYERGEKDTVKKAIEWIKYNNENGGCSFDGWEMDFRKYMEDEK